MTHLTSVPGSSPATGTPQEQRLRAATKQLDYNEVYKSSIDGMLHTLDPHSNYFDAKEFEQFRTEQSSRYYGIGATIGA